MNTQSSSYLSLFFRRFICFILASTMIFQTGLRKESHAIPAALVAAVTAVGSYIKAHAIEIGIDLAIGGLYSYLEKQWSSDDDDDVEEFYMFCLEHGVDLEEYADNPEGVMTDPDFISLYESFNYNAGMYGSTAQHVAEQLIEWNISYPNEINSYFNNWRIIETGYQAEFTENTYLESEKSAAANSSLINVVEPTLARSDTIGLVYTLPEFATNSMHFYKNTYLSSDVFVLNEDVSFYHRLNNNGVTGINNKYTDYDTSQSELQTTNKISIFRYDGDDYLNDSKFFSPLSNSKWTQLSDFTHTTTLTLEADKMHILVYCISVKPYIYANMKTRDMSYVITTPLNPNLSINGSSNFEPYFKKSPEGIDSPVYTSIITNYTNYYVDGNWYEGDHNGDNNTGGGSGSGDGSLSGDVNVTVDGELDHHLDGDINVNVNIDTEPGDPEETNGIIAWILNNILSFIGNCITYILDTIFSLFESVIEEFLGWLPDLVNTEVFQAINSIFSWLPEKASNFITFAILIALFVGIFGYFKR